jgi:hypothetical protein
VTVSPATDDSTMRAAAKAVVDKAPALTTGQRDKLRVLLARRTT